jgi:DNA polymerase elongation subunit (family B)
MLQPCDWYEHDVSNKYAVDVFGRTDEGKVACLRINGFKPYFYVRSDKRPEIGKTTKVQKYDVFAGFSELKKIDVWKVECDTKKMFTEAIKKCERGTLYESNLPPFLRLFHERHLGPASPIKFRKVRYTIPVDKETEEPLYSVDEFYQCEYTDIEAGEASIPLKVACYDLEMYSESGLFPQALKGDPIVQIGVSYRWSDKMLDPLRRVVFVVGSVDKSEDDTEFVSCKDEEDMLYKFAHEIRIQNPDVMCGYNTFGFDDAYIEDRCKQLGILDEINLCRTTPVMTPTFRNNQLVGFNRKFSETKKFELASGKYDLRFMSLRGRLGLDLLLNMRREHNLDSFKLDNVASVFLRDKVLDYKDNVITTKSTRGLAVGNFIRFDVVGNTSDPYRDGEKYPVTSISGKSFTISAPKDLFTDLGEKERKCLEWTFSKDDVEPHELFDLHKNGGPSGRARIAKYCIQDCDLVLTLMAKLDTLVNARGMADVCKVPMEYVLRRGQGIKIFSAVLYYASQRDQIIQTQSAIDGEGEGYEGAIVISPKIGMYLDQPISVLDFNSLYPTNMIAYNLSPDTLVSVRVFDADGNRLDDQCEGYTKAGIDKLVEKGYVVEEVSYDNKDEKDNIIGKTTCTFVQATPDNPMTVGVLPKTLDILLKKRKEFKEKMEDEQYDEAQRSVYNGLQLAYKVVANSVYGQTGSRTSPIRKLPVAACTTAAGRKALGLAKHIVETEFGAQVIYGDTDSIFIRFPTKDLAKSIELGIAAGKSITSQCRSPYKIAYEKTFYPFILFCRKRYVGMMYEEDPKAKPKRKSMGIVLKRRDNAPIVKDVFGGALDVLLQEQDVKKAQEFVNHKLMEVLENKVPLEKFIVSKSLRDDYKNPDQIAHRVLADRMTKRDPGTAPKVGDRLQYIYVAENKSASKQGDRIEEVSYVRTKKLTPDTQFYITNQIQNPVAQLFALCIEELNGYVPPLKPTYESLMEQMMEKYGDEEEATLGVLAKKEKQLDSIMFLSSPVLSKVIKRNTRGPLDAFFGKISR